MKSREAGEQEALIEWAYFMEAQFPELELLYHIPNGGSRHRIEAIHLKQQGVKAGVPDLHLPVARGGYHSLYIEMKVKGNRPTPKQIHWHMMLVEQGNKVEVCYSFDEAKSVILDYLRSTRVE